MSQTMNNNRWIEWNWTPEKPYPETLDTLVYIKCLSDGYVEGDFSYPSPVSEWLCDSIVGEGKNIWEPHHHGSITHYRLA